MKIKLIITGLMLVCAGVLVGIASLLYDQQRFAKYEFNTGADGQIIWQCNRQTGEVKIFTDYTAPYELYRGQNQDYLLNRQTGETWRYFQNDTNSSPEDGFSPLPHGYPTGWTPPATDPIIGTNAVGTTPPKKPWELFASSETNSVNGHPGLAPAKFDPTKPFQFVPPPFSSEKTNSSSARYGLTFTTADFTPQTNSPAWPTKSTNP